MKKLVVVLLMIVSASVFGQSKSVKKFRSAHEPDQVFVVYKSTMRMFANMAENMSQLGESELPDMNKLIEGLNEIRLFVYKDSRDMPDLLKKLKADVMAEGYEVVVSTRIKGQYSYVMQKSKGELPTDFVLIMSNEGGVQVVDVDGAPDLNSLQKFVKYVSDEKNGASLLDAFR